MSVSTLQIDIENSPLKQTLSSRMHNAIDKINLTNQFNITNNSSNDNYLSANSLFSPPVSKRKHTTEFTFQSPANLDSNNNRKRSNSIYDLLSPQLSANIINSPSKISTPRNAHSNSNIPNFTSPLSKLKSPTSSNYKSDRFIPNRENISHSILLNNVNTNANNNQENINNANIVNNTTTNASTNNSKQLTPTQTRLAESLFNDKLNASILSYRNNKITTNDNNYTSNLYTVYSAKKNNPNINNISTNNDSNINTNRYINPQPYRVLDAPSIIDDYYLNLLDWSSNNTLCVCLSNSVYLYNANTHSIDCLIDSNNNPNNINITSCKFNIVDNNLLAIGFDNNNIHIYDVLSKKLIHHYNNIHNGRISCLAWNNNILTSSGRDSIIINNDIRINNNSNINKYCGHNEEVCGIQWNNDNNQLASGGNDNLCFIWDNKMNTQYTNNNNNNNNTHNARLKLTYHTAAVKAISWCPWISNLLATGGGTADKHIRFINTNTGTQINSINTNSQVCTLNWSKNNNQREIVSSHGFSLNQLSVWKFNNNNTINPNPIIQLKGHTSRVLYTSLSPDNSTVVSAAGDETLRFWKIWDSYDVNQQKKHDTVLGLNINSPLNLKIR